MARRHRTAIAAGVSVVVFVAAATVLVSRSVDEPEPSLPEATPTPVPTPAEEVLVGAGDIAACGRGTPVTAGLLDAIEGTVFTAGDNAYDSGKLDEFNACYEPTWGRHKARTRPSPGNHDYVTPGAADYFTYFGDRARPPDKGYYSYELGAWHVVSLNSNCYDVGCDAGSPQERWLREDLAANDARCTIAYWHHPLFTSPSVHAPWGFVRPIFQALYDLGADVVVTGHNHNYERFAPQDPSGALDRERGIRTFVVGTGGAGLYAFTGAAAANSEVRDDDTYGVLKLTLRASDYEWEFVPEPGKTFTDSGSATCH